MLFRQIFLDTAKLIKQLIWMRWTRKKSVQQEDRRGCFTLACAALEPDQKARPVYPFLSDYRRVWEMDLAVGAYKEITTYFRLFDPRHEREDEIFRKLGYIDVQFLSPRIKGETLMFTGLSDTICPPSTQFAAYNKISARKRIVLYPDFGHETLPEQR